MAAGASEGPAESTGSGVDLTAPTRLPKLPHGQWLVLIVVAVGGGIGAVGRYGAGLLWPSAPSGFPITTLGINLVGCATIGVFMVLSTEVWSAHRLIRPFIGTGVLGGFTTFSTYAVDIQRLVVTGHVVTGMSYLAVTLIAALVAVGVAVVATRALFAVGRRR